VFAQNQDTEQNQTSRWPLAAYYALARKQPWRNAAPAPPPRVVLAGGCVGIAQYQALQPRAALRPTGTGNLPFSLDVRVDLGIDVPLLDQPVAHPQALPELVAGLGRMEPLRNEGVGGGGGGFGRTGARF